MNAPTRATIGAADRRSSPAEPSPGEPDHRSFWEPSVIGTPPPNPVQQAKRLHAQAVAQVARKVRLGGACHFCNRAALMALDALVQRLRRQPEEDTLVARVGSLGGLAPSDLRKAAAVLDEFSRPPAPTDEPPSLPRAFEAVSATERILDYVDGTLAE